MNFTPISALERCRGVALVGLAVGAVFVLSACGGGRGGAIPYAASAADFPEPDRPSQQLGTSMAEYRISPLDKLQISVFQVPDLSRDVEVDLGGDITMPLIGSIRAADATTIELKERLQEQLSQKYLRNPDVTVVVKESSRRRITIDGAVRDPGQFDISGPTTLLRAVSLAGGASDTANLRRVGVFRQIEGKRMAAAFDLAAIRRGQAEDPVIYTGDIIVVDGSRLRAIQREIFQNLPLLAIFRPF